MLRTNLRTVHNSMTPVQFKRIVQLIQPFLRKLIPRILNPPVRLHEHRRSQILIGIPPVRGAGGGTARTEYALVHPVQFGTILPCL